MKRWNGCVAFVSGASKGIGARICRKLVKHGMIVVGCARNVALIDAIAEEEKDNGSTGELHGMQCDLSNELEVLAMFEEIKHRFGHIDVCINNAGFSSTSSFKACETHDLRNILEVNIMALSICTRESIRLMHEKNADGIIIQVVQIGSVIGHMVPKTPPVPSPGYSMYMSVKYMIRAFTEALRQEIEPKDTEIRVANITPGKEVTEFLFGNMDPEEARQKFIYANRSEAEVIADYVINILETPTGEKINDIMLLPIDFRA